MLRQAQSATDQDRHIWQLIAARNWQAAAESCRQLNAEHPRYAAGWYTASHIGIGLGSAADALRHIEHALAIEPANARFLLQRSRCLQASGRLRDAAAAAAEACRHARAEAPLLDAIGTALAQANDQLGALAAYDRAIALAPDNARFVFNRAAVRRYLGALTEAQADYDRAIALDPLDYEAYRNRSDLCTQTAASNHVAELEGLLARGAPWQGEVQLRYALAKEYEDLGEYERSFEQLQRGATLRRRHLRYDVAADVATVQWIVQAFPAAAFTGPTAAAAGAAAAAAPAPAPGAGPGPGPAPRPDDAPIFIVGLPRSGTTLVDRILGSHPAVRSAGELPSFALAVVDAVRRQSAAEPHGAPAGRPPHGAGAGGAAPLPREQLVARSARLDFAALGRDYLQRARAAGASPGRFTDKMPLNYLYLGLIRRALPCASIVHVSRGPMAVCYAMYKTLFRDGYPFSYDLGELASYYIAYRRLMSHWQQTLAQGLHTLHYEQLVADQLGQTRTLLRFCDLDWQDACLRFHDNPSATTTASAAQVRRPLYDSSVHQWRHYARQLSGLAERLRAAGIEPEGIEPEG
ncbi:MAG TPA: sulfotransferase [Steroidobacteraceae bacterium]|nr:sulfotransferase [Steroidobacteraceae bacterium]